MKKSKINLLLLAIVVIFVLCSCEKGGNDLCIDISPSDKSLVDLTSKIYCKEELLEFAKSNESLNELNAKYPIECLRAENGIYRVSYLGDDSVAIILFDGSGNKISGDIFSMQLRKSDFDGLDKGQPLDRVMAMDPNGEYLFLYTGRNDTPRVSTHYTKDGYVIAIEYDTSNLIINIETKLI